jgi:hypothetical protein
MPASRGLIEEETPRITSTFLGKAAFVEGGYFETNRSRIAFHHPQRQQMPILVQRI